MKRLTQVLWLLGAMSGMTLGVAHPAGAFRKSEENAGREAERPEGFESIFNGRDLTGWEGSANYWEVQDGCLTGTADGTLKYNRFIVTGTGSTVTPQSTSLTSTKRDASSKAYSACKFTSGQR